MTKEKDITISLTRKGVTHTTTQRITVIDAVQSVTITGLEGKTFKQGSTLDLTGVSVTAQYLSGTTKDVTGDCVFTPAAGSVIQDSGEMTVQVSYTEDGITQSTSATVTVTEGLKIVSWAEGTWEEIAAMIDAHDEGEINIYDYWKVGDTKTISLAAMTATEVGESHVAQDVEIVLVDKNVVDLMDGGKCHFVWQQKGILANGSSAEYGYMNGSDTNVDGWWQSARKKWCTNVYYRALPSGLKSITKTSSIKTSKGNSKTNMDITMDRIFLPAEWNIFGETIFSVAGEDTVQWEYYKTESNRIKYIGNTTTAYYWWLRSPQANDANSFCEVMANGSAYHAGAFAGKMGIAPCGCI